MQKHIRKIKIYFTVCAICAVSFLIGGIFVFRNERTIHSIAVQNTLDYLQYKIEADYNGSGYLLLAQIASILGGPPSQTEAQQQRSAQAIPVLLYHGIDPTSDRFTITPKNFKEHMFSLKAAGYQTISLSDFEAFMRGEKEFPRRSFLLTFDDGRRDSYYEADPILQALGYQAVMFISTQQSLPSAYTKEGYYLSQDELEQMISSKRWDIQSHAIQEEGGFVPIDDKDTYATFLSNRKWISSENRLETEEEYTRRIEHELRDSKMRIEEVLKTPVTAFAFPFGDYGQQTKNNPSASEIIQDSINKNYTLAFRQTWPYEGEFSFNYPQDTGYQKRIEPHPSWSADQLIATLAQAEPKNLPYQETFEGETGWRNVWGEMQQKDGTLVTYATDRTQGSFILLDGSRLWNDYKVSADIIMQKGGYVSLISRYQKDDTYLACIFAPSYVRIEELRKGEKTMLTQTAYPIPSKEASTIHMEVYKDRVNCGYNDRIVVQASAQDPLIADGGIGIKTWDEEINNTFLEIDRIVVQSPHDAQQIARAAETSRVSR